MGDMGSLGLGGALAAVAMLTKLKCLGDHRRVIVLEVISWSCR